MLKISCVQAQQHEADRRHASSNAMIQLLRQKGMEIQWRMDRICSKILSDQQHQQQLLREQQQQRSRAAHVSLAVGNAQLPELSMQRPQELADRLLAMLDQQQRQQQEQQVSAEQLTSEAREEPQHIDAAQEAAPTSSRVGAAQNDAVAVAAAVAAAIAAERSGQLSAEGSKAWQQKLREQLLGSSSAEPHDGGLKQQLQQQQQHVSVTATAAGVLDQAPAGVDGMGSRAKVIR
jgi:hypothetical protein